MSKNVRGELLISGLKSINQLSFPVPKKGVWLLTGKNGAGKSAVLSCLYRIKYNNAFRDHFPTSTKSRRLDNYRGAEITYKVGDHEIKFTRNEFRWASRPKNSAEALKEFKFDDVMHVGATADRLSPKPEDFDPNRSRLADLELRDAANSIFKTRKFSDLWIVNVTRGVNEAFVLRVGEASPYDYVSEKGLSVGELCVLKLLKRVLRAQGRFLMLIDELEIALHPTVQVRLFEYIRNLCSSRGHVAIFSTHSSTLIKSAKKGQIIHLRQIDKNHRTTFNPQKSFVLGQVAGEEELTNDVIYLVEDEAAKRLVESIIKKATEGYSIEKKPKYKVVKGGPWTACVDLYKTIHSQGDVITRPRLLLDNDISVTMQEIAKGDPGNGYVSVIKSAPRAFLPYTPDCFIALIASMYGGVFFDQFRVELGDPQIDFGDREIPRTSGFDNIDQCKGFVCRLSREAEGSGCDDVLRVLYNTAVSIVAQNNTDIWSSLRRAVL